ncbi:hypothetical protein Tco_0332770, partial [Tanacetum coccineum]
MQVEQTEPRNSVVPNRKPKDKPRLNKGAKRLFIKKQHHREIWKYHVCFTKRVGCCSRVRRLLKLISAWIKSKNSLVKHFEDMRLCRPSKEYLQVIKMHNMIAYLEKTEGNVEFHEVIDFLRRSYIYHALTVSPVVSTTFVEQFWTSAKSKTINNVRHITAKIAGKSVSISEASIRTDLIFDDADGIDSLPNQAIFNAIQLMGYEG